MKSSASSRRQFTPENHWIMTSQMDLQSFIESAILEDQALDDENDAQNPRLNGRRSPLNENVDSDDEESARPQAIIRRNVPSRRQMTFLSPRLGVLNNSMSLPPSQEIRISEVSLVKFPSLYRSKRESQYSNNSSQMIELVQVLLATSLVVYSQSVPMGGVLPLLRQFDEATWPMTDLRLLTTLGVN